MKFDYHVIVIGAGGAGISTASGCAMFGAKTAMIEKGAIGGECLKSGCVPSKALINGAHIIKAIHSAGAYGISAELHGVDFLKLLDHGKSAIDAIAARESKEKFTGMGIDVIDGEGVFTDRHTVRIGSRSITGKYIVIAAGSRPMVPPIPGLQNTPYLTNETIFDLKRLPAHLVILGGGPVGLEFGQTFRYLGADVTIIDLLPRLFPKDDPEVAAVLEKKFRSEGVRLLLSSRILEVAKAGEEISVAIENMGSRQEIKGDALLVALGRAPGLEGLGIENAQVTLDTHGYVRTGEDMRTNIRHIFACGDVTGQFQFSHMAGYQAGIVVRNIISPIGAKADYSFVPWVTFTKPEVAHVGYTEQIARSMGIFRESVVVDMELSDRAVLEFQKEGFIKFVLGKRNRLLGVTIVGDRASEMIGLASLALIRKMSGTAFYPMIMPYPTDAELYRSASKVLLKNALKPWIKKLVRRFLVG